MKSKCDVSYIYDFIFIDVRQVHRRSNRFESVSDEKPWKRIKIVLVALRWRIQKTLCGNKETEEVIFLYSLDLCE